MNERPITSLRGLQLAAYTQVAAATPNERKGVDELAALAVAYRAKYRVRTDRDRARAERRIRKRAKTKLIGGGILEAIVISLLAQLAMSFFRWLWRVEAQMTDAERTYAAMAVGLPAWTDADDPTDDEDD